MRQKHHIVEIKETYTIRVAVVAEDVYDAHDKAEERIVHGG